MARKSRYRTNPIEYRSPYRFAVPAVSLGRLVRLRAAVLSMDDRRLFHPSGSLRPAGALSRGARRLVVAPSASTAPGDFSRIGFAVPKKVALCVRRRVRREVILATGRGGGGHRPPKRNYWSDVEC